MNTSIKKQCKKITQLLNINSDCDWTILNYKEVGRGMRGYTMKVSCNGESKYVVKVLPNQKLHLIEREIKMQNKFDDEGNFIRLYLIDFGKSTQYSTQQEADIEESYDDIKLSFNMYKRRDNKKSPQKLYKKTIKSPKKINEREYKTPNKKLSFDDDDEFSSVSRSLF